MVLAKEPVVVTTCSNVQIPKKQKQQQQQKEVKIHLIDATDGGG